MMVLGLFSCNKPQEAVSWQNPMSFSTYTGRSTTKAGDSFVTSAQLPAGKAFTVYAYNTGSAAAFDAASLASYDIYMNGVAVTYTGGDASNPDKYTYSPLRYWPQDGDANHLAFFAYYPSEGAGISGDGFGDFTFTVQAAAADQVDFMLSDVVPGQTYASNAGVVPMVFHHTLSQIRFKGITDAPAGATVKITAVELKDIISEGILAADATAMASIWVPSTTLSDFSIAVGDIALPSTAVDASAEAVAIAEDDQALLMLPQSLSDEAKLNVTYSITTTSPARTITQTQVIDLKDAIAAWTMNQQIVYTLNIGLHPIEISASLADWIENAATIIIE